MIRTCSADDPFIGDGSARCGATIDDVSHSTICPHRYIPTQAERDVDLRALLADPGSLDPQVRGLVELLLGDG